MRKYRIISQTSFFLLFISAFFLINKNPYAYKIESELFLFLNPFSGIIVSLASRSVIFPLLMFTIVMVILVVLFGRFFCGFICPLGASIDFLDRFFFLKMRSVNRRFPEHLRRLKYVIMVLALILSLFGAVLPLLLDPLSLMTRFLTILVNPVLKIVGLDLIRIAGLFSPLLSNLLYTSFPLKMSLYYGVMLTLVMAALVFAGGIWEKRFWCGYVCPSGAFMGIISRYSFFRRNVKADQCNSCSRCVRACPVGAINPKEVGRTLVSECIECGVCVDLKDSCSTFHLSLPVLAGNTLPDLHRRHLVAGAAGGLLMVPVFRATAIGKRDDHGRLIRPPGALPEEQFMARCLGCGECMKVCPTNALQPCMFTDGFSRIFTPKVVPRVGGCEEKCSICGYVCPTSAIRKLPLEDKQFAKIGTAVIDRHRCLAWEQNRECLVCDEVCPYNAIEFRMVDTVEGRFKVPVVYEDLCIGCGLCEQHCPIFDAAAIVVYKFGENRRSHGTYVSKWQKETILERRRKSDSVHLDFEPGAEKSNNDSQYFNQDESSSGFSDGFVE